LQDLRGHIYHPSNQWRQTAYRHANIGELQTLAVHIARSRGLYKNVSTAAVMDELKFKQGANKMQMMTFLTSIGVCIYGRLQSRLSQNSKPRITISGTDDTRVSGSSAVCSC
jgi:hypothetical protein